MATLAELPPTAIPCLQVGVVKNNADPEGLYRVTIEIPGLIDETDWAPPLGTVGGGGPQRGGFVVPDVGATVGVLFHNGDIESPYYLPGWWGVPDAGSEMPVPAREAGELAHRVPALQIGKFRFFVDERDDQLLFRVEAGEDGKDAGVSLELDFKNKGITIFGLAAVIIKSLGLIHLDSLVQRVGDRVVGVSSKPV